MQSSYYNLLFSNATPKPRLGLWYTRYSIPFYMHYTAMDWDVRIHFTDPIEHELRQTLPGLDHWERRR